MDAITENKSNRGGPRFKSEKIRKDELISVKVSATEKRLIESFFMERGCSLSDGVRALLTTSLILKG